MSAFYLDVLKDRLYTWAVDSKERRSAQTVLYYILNLLNKLIAPVLAFTAEEVYGFIPLKDRKKSVFVDLLNEEETPEKWVNKTIRDNWNKISGIRNVVLKALEQKRIDKVIGNALEAKITLLTTKPELFNLLNKYKGVLPDVFIVSDVELFKVETLPPDGELCDEIPELSVKVEKFEGIKCPRCWRYVKRLDKRQGLTEVCSRCAEAICNIPS
jgi:isoleucyl-tRNA synthetase